LILAQNNVPAQPTFKSGINLVEIDVVILDKRGSPIRGLRQQDFEVFEDDKPVSVVTFEAVDLPQAPSNVPIPAPDRSATSVSSNDQPEDGRVLLIVMDDHHVRFGGSQLVKSKAIARRLVERLGPSDQAGVIATSGRSIMQVDFTADKARLIDAIDKFFPQGGPTASGAEMAGGNQRGTTIPGRGFGFEQALKARWAMDGLSNAAKTLALIPHRRKAVLLVSEGLPVSVEQIVTNPNASSAWQSLREFILTAQRSNVAVYPIDPCGLGLDCSKPAQENLRALAKNTGGFVIVNTNAPEEQVDRIVAESGTYYLLGYASPAPPYDGRRHRIQVRTRVPDAEIRAREYVSPRRPPRSADAKPPADALIAAPIQSRGLTMRLAGVPAPLASSPGATIVLGIEIPAKLAIAAGQINFTVAAVDPSSGRVRTRQRFTTTFEAVGSSTAGWARLRSHLPVPPGRYLIRVAALGADMTQGSVFTEVDVPRFDGDVALGGLCLAAPTRTRSVNGKEETTAPMLTPLATREIPAGLQLTAEVPILVRGVSTRLVMGATLRTPDGRDIQLDSGMRDASAYAKGGGGTYRVTLPADLPIGSYQLLVQATAGRTRVSREISFRVHRE
jgi:VWFA-related protein